MNPKNKARLITGNDLILVTFIPSLQIYATQQPVLLTMRFRKQ